MKKKLLVALTTLMFAVTMYAANLTVCLGMLPSTNVVGNVRVSYGSQLNTYTNSLTFSSEFVNAQWITNAPFTGRNFRECVDELIPCYWKVTISNLVGGQTFAIKIENVFRDRWVANVFESGCLITVPSSSTNKPNIPSNLRFAL